MKKSYLRNTVMLILMVMLLNVTAFSEQIAVTGVELGSNSIMMALGAYSYPSNKLHANVLPDNATNKNIMWSSSDEGVATVADGVVTAISYGTAIITVETEDGGFKDTCTVSVIADGGGTICIDWVPYSPEELIDAADHIFIGRVTNISFEVTDMTTALPATEETKDSNLEFNTIYDIDIIKPYKGAETKTIQIRMYGGIVNYRVNEQLDILRKYETFVCSHPFIPCEDEYFGYRLYEGNEYLFAAFDSQYPDRPAYIGDRYEFIFYLTKPDEIPWYSNLMGDKTWYQSANYILTLLDDNYIDVQDVSTTQSGENLDTSFVADLARNQEGTLIAAVYNKNEELVALQTRTRTLTSPSLSYPFDFTLSKDSEYTVKICFWQSVETPRPLCDSYSFEI